MTLFDHTVNDYITVVCNRMPIFRDGQLVGAAAVTTMQNITETISRLHSEIQDIKKEMPKVVRTGHFNENTRLYWTVLSVLPIRLLKSKVQLKILHFLIFSF